MVEYAIQHLCFTGALQLHWYKVRAHPSNPHIVTRLFLERVAREPSTYQAEAFLLDLFPAGECISLGQLRMRLRDRLPDEERFKYEQVQHDLRADGLLALSFLPSAAGRTMRRAIRRLVQAFELRAEALVRGAPKDLNAALDAMGSLVVLVNDDVRTLLRREVQGRTPDLDAVFAIASFMETNGVYMSSGLTYGGTGSSGGFGSGGGGGGGGFGGFGGGGFGGGGAGGSW